MDRRRQEDKPCNVTVIFTTAKDKQDLTPIQQKHWDELYTRCVSCKVEVSADDMDGYFSNLTGGKVADISKRIKTLSMRAAWDWIDENDIDIVG
jgi:hypothetical protein